ncbi:triosephosphate isomerase [Motilibacter rhizosphaerae]|uniref:Triosephosphate isomerase n=1 Tax=Motilibacter rhizosphaerae TaxID=598652 RepID=A0A4Q7NFW8_9ACTN|nr:triose-phosphate isomerase [Motilibacter rhizosphaerae]RZS82817.1 triosephosphate isomerase [Motilibacter rhizosphaerae]
MASTTRKPLLAGNWKMTLNHLEAIRLVQDLAFRLDEKDFEKADVVVLPPFVDIRSVQTLVDGDDLRIAYGAQDISAHDKGAYTGETSGSMLAKLGVTYVVVGHSERRQYHHEDDALVGAKVKAALRHELTPILCVGEGLEVRKAGEHVAHTVAQLLGALDGLSAEEVAKVVVAYEPVWAIGTGEVATPEDAQEVCAAVRAALASTWSPEVAAAVRVLYGGSVKGSNAGAIMAQADVDGALVGGASLDAEDFTRIVRFDAAPEASPAS